MVREKRIPIKQQDIICASGEIAHGYELYLKTDHWRNMRKYVAQYYNNTCQSCGKVLKSGYHIHHLNYKSIGNEQIFDLVFLCETCHMALHNNKKKTDASKPKNEKSSKARKNSQKKFEKQSKSYPQKAPKVVHIQPATTAYQIHAQEIKLLLMTANEEQIENILYYTKKTLGKDDKCGWKRIPKEKQKE